MKPFISCFMYASLDGHIDCAMTEKIDPEAKAYYTYLKEFNDFSMINGKTTCAMHYAGGEFKGNATSGESSSHLYKGKSNGKPYHICFDTKGSLLWNETDIEGRQLLVVTSEKVTQSYTDFLESKNIPYISCGKESIDIAGAMEILNKEFGVSKAVLTGGGHINGAFLDAGLINEVDMMYGPGIDGRSNWACAFDGRTQEKNPVNLKLKEVKQMEYDTVLLKYLVKN